MVNSEVDDSKWGVHWFRRDLRIAGNEAFVQNFETHKGRVLGLFCFDSQFLSRDDFSHRRFAFFLETLKSLKADLAAIGVELLVVDMQPLEAFTRLASVAKKASIDLPDVSFNRDYEPFAINRENLVSGELTKLGFKHQNFRDHLLIEPHEILKDDGTPFQKYSAFAKQWRNFLKTVGSERVEIQSRQKLKNRKVGSAFSKCELGRAVAIEKSFSDALSAFERENGKHFQGELPEAGFDAAITQLKIFETVLPHYSVSRSTPSVKGSSELSKFLKNGSLTLPQILAHFNLLEKKLSQDEDKFLAELIWREYYYYILFHYPYVESGPFHKKYAGLKWNQNVEHLKAWKEGRTGVPIVDAGMRELNESGFINNRVRIIVGAFLTKDLYINWQDGERYFMNQLIDGDLAANNGNWQWVASTGSENQPYFRVMNPWLQSEKFDPDGEYIKRWLPELAKCPVADLHNETADRSAFSYPKPIVNHSIAKSFAIESFKSGS